MYVDPDAPIITTLNKGILKQVADSNVKTFETKRKAEIFKIK